MTWSYDDGKRIVTERDIGLTGLSLGMIPGALQALICRILCRIWRAQYIPWNRSHLYIADPRNVDLTCFSLSSVHPYYPETETRLEKRQYRIRHVDSKTNAGTSSL